MAPAKRPAWLGWGIAAAVFVAFATIALLNMQIGLHGDPRTTNPTPGAPPYPPFLGVTNWPLVTTVMSAMPQSSMRPSTAWPPA